MATWTSGSVGALLRHWVLHGWVRIPPVTVFSSLFTLRTLSLPLKYKALKELIHRYKPLLH